MKHQNILLAAMSLDYGGAETHVTDLAIELLRRGHNVTVASAGGRLVPRLEHQGIPHFVMPMNSRSPVKLARAITMAKAIVQGRDIGIIHAHGRIPAWVFTQARARNRVALVTTYHGVYAAGLPWSLFTRQGDLSIAVSEDIKTHFVSKMGFDPDRFTVIPNGIDASRFVPGPYPDLRDRLAPAGGPVITNVSRLDEFAGVALALVEALPVLVGDYPGATAVIVGDGDKSPEVSRKCDEINRTLGRPAAQAVGGQHDVVPYLQSSDVVVAVARAALEAMACAKPVVLAGEGGIRDTLTEHSLPELQRHNFTARGSDVVVTSDALAKHIDSLLSSPEIARSSAELGRQVVLSHYSWDALMPKVLEVYDRALHLIEGRDPGATV